MKEAAPRKTAPEVNVSVFEDDGVAFERLHFQYDICLRRKQGADNKREDGRQQERAARLGIDREDQPGKCDHAADQRLNAEFLDTVQDGKDQSEQRAGGHDQCGKCNRHGGLKRPIQQRKTYAGRQKADKSQDEHITHSG